MNLGSTAFLIAFPLFWCAVTLLISGISGWAKLAPEYPGRPQRDGVIRRFMSARMRYTSRYGGCLMVGADAAGLHLSVLFLFRPGHPRLFMPWSEVTAMPLAPRTVQFNFVRIPDVPLIVSRALADQLAAASHGRLKLPDGA